MAIFIIDGLTGSGREDVASWLARALRCPLISAEQLAQWAEAKGVDRKAFLARLEKPFGFMHRLLTKLVRALAYEPKNYVMPSMTLWFPNAGFPYYTYPNVPQGENPGEGPPPSSPDQGPLDISRMRALLKELFLKTAGSGNAVVVGCGAQAVFASAQDALKVFLVAPLKERAVKLAEELRVGLEEAERMVARMDGARRRFVKDIFGGAWDDLDNYHLVVDASKLGPSQIASLALRAATEGQGANITSQTI